MRVAVNMSQEVYEYFKNYNLSEVANVLLEQYDFTSLPQTSGLRDVERVVDITDPVYIQLYKTVGPRSKKVSLGRLFEFAYNMDYLAKSKIQPTGRVDNPTSSLVKRAYIALLAAQKYDDSKELKDLTQLVYQYKEIVK